jgi:hypothetical protein
MAARLDDEIRIFWQNAMTRVRMGRLWIRNVLRNLPLVAGSRPLPDLESDLPTVVVGAGPSTDDHLAELPRDGDEARRGLRIISVDTAVAPLAAQGVTPEVVVAVESQQANAADFLAPHSRALARSHLICDLSAYPGLAHLFPPERISFVASSFAPTILLDRLEDGGHLPARVPPLGSVGVLAVHLALRITRAPVYFMGLDFAYDLERTHAAGSPFHTRALIRRTRLDPSPFFGLALSRPLLTLTDKRGLAVRSDTVLLSYAEQLRTVTAEATDVYDLAPEAGLPSGAPPPPAETPGGRGPSPRAARQTAAGQASPRRSPSQRTAEGARVDTEVDTLLATEEAHLSRLIEGLREALHRAGTDAAVADIDYAALMPLLDAADYVYLDFPDPPAPTRAFLGRVMQSRLPGR